MFSLHRVKIYWYVFFFSQATIAFKEEKGVLLPEVKEDLTNKSTGCYLRFTQLQPSCKHKPHTVVGIESVNVGSKLNSTTCPRPEHGGSVTNEACCRPEDGDCNFPYRYQNYNDSTNVEWNFYRNCSGYDQCLTSFPVVYAPTDNSICVNQTYQSYSSYMFFNYSCIDESRIHSVARHKTFKVSFPLVYLQTDQYPEAFLTGYVKSVCNVTSSGSTISVYTLDIRFEEDSINGCQQSLLIEDVTGPKSWDCSYKDGFNISKLTFSAPTKMTFESNTSAPTGRVWLGIEGSGLTFNCNSTLPDEADKEKETEDKKDDGVDIVPILIGVGVCSLVVIIIVIICCILKSKKSKRKTTPARTVGNDVRGKMFNTHDKLTTSMAPMSTSHAHSRLSDSPASNHFVVPHKIEIFSTSQTQPNSSLLPTQYITEHDATVAGISVRSDTRIPKRSHYSDPTTSSSIRATPSVPKTDDVQDGDNVQTNNLQNGFGSIQGIRLPKLTPVKTESIKENDATSPNYDYSRLHDEQAHENTLFPLGDHVEKKKKKKKKRKRKTEEDDKEQGTLGEDKMEITEDNPTGEEPQTRERKKKKKKKRKTERDASLTDTETQHYNEKEKPVDEEANGAKKQFKIDDDDAAEKTGQTETDENSEKNKEEEKKKKTSGC